MPFAGMFQSMAEQTSALDTKASEAVTGLLSGQGVDIHDAMIATEKADMAFELALQVRNKAVGAYQQMMSMQF
jgi:flagellar hook-basal body complex protein FliE